MVTSLKPTCLAVEAYHKANTESKLLRGMASVERKEDGPGPLQI